MGIRGGEAKVGTDVLNVQTEQVWIKEIRKERVTLCQRFHPPPPSYYGVQAESIS